VEFFRHLSSRRVAASIVLISGEDKRILETAKTLGAAHQLRVVGTLQKPIIIDDFGTGFSSMEQLRRIPFNELKIDKSFVTGASRNLQTRAMFEASVDLAKKLELVVVAEGVESREDLGLVADLGCDIAQGYYLARPMDAQTLLPWIHDWHTETRLSG
jgi:EAL domain-containing protein (putative c-di-GMP-specific phosphodiesterase class I)